MSALSNNISSVPASDLPYHIISYDRSSDSYYLFYFDKYSYSGSGSQWKMFFDCKNIYYVYSDSKWVKHIFYNDISLYHLACYVSTNGNVVTDLGSQSLALSNFNILDENNHVLFFGSNQQNGDESVSFIGNSFTASCFDSVLSGINVILPLVLVTVVCLLGFRKAWQFLKSQVKG